MANLGLVEQIAGALIIASVLVDIFLTILYARIGTGIISNRLAKLTWRLFRWAGSPLRRGHARFLSFCGPCILVLLVLVWSLALTLGTALVIHPKLGSSIRCNSGVTPTDFWAAMYSGGSSMSVVGSGDMSPATPAFRMFYLFNSLSAMSALSLTLTYLLQIYNALLRRNAFGLKLHLLTAETGDAAELLARLGPNGQFDSGYSTLSDIAAEMAALKESHHFYPVLFYFRFTESYYSVSSSALLALDTVTLIETALSETRYGWLKHSGSIAQLRLASLMIVKTLADAFARGTTGGEPEPQRAETRERWKHRYFAALERIRAAGIETSGDEQAGAEEYVSRRFEWYCHIARLAPFMAYSIDAIDPAFAVMEWPGQR